MIDYKAYNLELAEIYIPRNARDHIKALLPYAVGRSLRMSSERGFVGWELKLRIPKRLINPDVDIEFLRRNNITMEVEAEEVGYGGISSMREPEYYNINLSYNEQQIW